MNPPTNLVNMQKWFASVLTLPLAPDAKLPKEGIEKEAEGYINPSKTLLPLQRIEIYHQQYWWRLLDTLQEIYPTLARLFGANDFSQQIAIPYLSQNPPQHWSLAHLGEDLPNWLKQHYKQIDATLVWRLGAIDKAFQSAFLAPDTNPMPFFLFELNCDLFTFRQTLISQPIDYWQKHPFPEIAFGTFHFLLFRNQSHDIEWNEISEETYIFLNL